MFHHAKTVVYAERLAWLLLVLAALLVVLCVGVYVYFFHRGAIDAFCGIVGRCL